MSKLNSATNRSPIPDIPPMSELVSEMMIRAQDGKLEEFVSFLESDDERTKLDKDTIQELLNQRDEEDKSALDYSSLLQRLDIINELIQRGININDCSKSGYSALHHAAAWGKKKAVELLVDNGAMVLSQTKQNSQTARDVALRYKQEDVVEYLEWAEAKYLLVNEVFHMKDVMTDGEKNLGRLNREDKNLINSVCNEAETWITATLDASLDDFIKKRAQIIESFAVINAKLAEPPSLTAAQRRQRAKLASLDVQRKPSHNDRWRNLIRSEVGKNKD